MSLANWRQRSLRSWVALGMALATLPVAISLVVDHVLLAHGVVADFADVAARYRDQIGPVQSTRLALRDAAEVANEFLDTREGGEWNDYQAERTRIEHGFAELHRTLGADARQRAALQHAENEWRTADSTARGLASMPPAREDPRAVRLEDRFNGCVRRSVHDLRGVHDDLDADLKVDHAAALVSYQRTDWVMGIAILVSLLLMLAGVVVIGRIMVANIERLVDGARRFAAGNRSHRIDVQVPPELRRVADEFNSMIARIRESETALAEEAREDPMTGLANRRAFDEALHTAFARMRRLDERVLLFMLDVDHFKSVNDTHGHAAGDEVLRSIGQTLAANIREVDRAFRIGGEEFVVLLTGTDTAGASIAAERLRETIAAHPVSTEQGEILVTVSIGIARAEREMQPEQLLKAADAALYEAKSKGRNRVAVALAQERAAT